MTPLLSCCGHGVPIGCYCAPCRAMNEPDDVPPDGNPREPVAQPRRFSRWPEFLSRWGWPSDAGECIE